MFKISIKLFVIFSLYASSFLRTFADQPKINTETRNAIVPKDVPSILEGDGAVGFDLLNQVLIYIRNFIFDIMILIVVGVFLYIGIKMAASRGDTEEFKKSVTAFVYVIVGIFIIGIAYVLVRFVAGIDIAGETSIIPTTTPPK